MMIMMMMMMMMMMIHLQAAAGMAEDKAGRGPQTNTCGERR